MKTPRFCSSCRCWRSLAVGAGADSAYTDAEAACHRRAATRATVSGGVRCDTGDNLDPAKIAEYQKRFEEGYALEQQGKLPRRGRFMTAFWPRNRRPSVRFGGGKNQLQARRVDEGRRLPGKASRAGSRFSRGHRVADPDQPGAQTRCKGRAAAEGFSRVARQRQGARVVPLALLRAERIHLDAQDIVISQFFDYTQDPNTV